MTQRENGNGLFHCIIRISSWGDSTGLLNRLREKDEVYSIFHIMGGASYLLDCFCHDKIGLRDLVLEIKRYTIASSNALPVVNSLTTQKILKVYKSSIGFNITHYLGDKIYGFILVNNLRNHEGFLRLILDVEDIKSVLYLQGDFSYLLEIMAQNNEEVFDLIQAVQTIESVTAMETQEVISIIKYRGVLREEPMAKPRFIVPSLLPEEIITI